MTRMSIIVLEEKVFSRTVSHIVIEECPVHKARKIAPTIIESKSLRVTCDTISITAREVRTFIMVGTDMEELRWIYGMVE